MGIFNLDLQTQVQPMETPVNQATSTALGGLSNFVSAMGTRKNAMDQAKEDAARKAAAAAPTYTEVKDQQEKANLSAYSTEVADATQKWQSSSISHDAYLIELKKIDTKFAIQGVDVSSSAFDTARTAITGIPSTNWGMTETDMLFGDLSKTPDGQGKLALANYNLAQSLGREPTRDEVAAQVQADMAVKANYDNTVIKNQAELQQKLPIIQGQVVSVAKNFSDSLDILDKAGVPATPEMLQNTYVQYKSFKTEALAKLPADTPQSVKDDLFKLTDEFFIAHGMEQTNGVFKLEPTDVLQAKYKAQLIVQALEKTGKTADTLLALGIVKNGYTISPQDQPVIDLALGNMDLTPSTPDYITEAGIVLSNDLISTAQVISAPNTVFLRDAKGYQKAFKDAIGQERYDINSKQTAAEGWSNFTSRSDLLKGFYVKNILDGKADPASVYTNMAGLATALGTVDFTNEAASFEGVRSSVTSNIMPIIDALEKVDPEKGKAARTLMFYSLGKAASEYDAQIKSEEQALNINFNPKSGAYELDLTKYAGAAADQLEIDRRTSLSALINSKFGSDLTQAVDKGITLTEADLRGLKGFEGNSLLNAQDLVNLYMNDLPEADRFKRVLDLRNSRVFLDNVAGQIEPKDIKERRMNTPAKIAGETMSTLAATEGTVTAGGITTGPITSSPNGYKPPEEVTKDTAFMGKVNSVSTDLGINPTDLLRVIEFETGKSFSPAVKSPNSSATGLIQFMGATAKDLGTSTEALAGMTRAEQMDYVAKYLAPYKGKIKNFGDLYLAVHWPKAIGKDEAYVMYEKGSKEYAANKNLDTNGDGTVTRGETIARVLSGTGGGKMTTPYTAQAEKMVQPGAQLLPPELSGGATAASTTTATPTQPMQTQAPTASPTLPEAVQGQQPTQQGEVKTAANTPIDQGILDTIANLSQNAADVRVFTTQDELVKAYDNQEINVGSLVVINGKLMSVTKEMIGAK